VWSDVASSAAIATEEQPFMLSTLKMKLKVFSDCKSQIQESNSQEAELRDVSTAHVILFK
jgi:hypothetical protein